MIILLTYIIYIFSFSVIGIIILIFLFPIVITFIILFLIAYFKGLFLLRRAFDITIIPGAFKAKEIKPKNTVSTKVELTSCSFCGESIPKDAKSCDKCGSSLN